MNPEEYAKHIFTLRHFCTICSGTVTQVTTHCVEVESDHQLYNCLRWPEAQYDLQDSVLIVVPPDDYAVAVPIDRNKWPDHDNSQDIQSFVTAPATQALWSREHAVNQDHA